MSSNQRLMENKRNVQRRLSPAPLLGDCSRVAGQKTISVPFIKAAYAISDSQLYVPAIGTLGRTGLCVHCDAAIYQRESLNGRFPSNLVGAKYHAVEDGLREMCSESPNIPS